MPASVPEAAPAPAPVDGASTAETDTVAVPSRPETTPAEPAPAVPAASGERPVESAGGTGEDHTALIAELVERTNAQRAAAGCPPLAIDVRLSAAAQAHSEDMAAGNYFDHTARNGRSPFDRIAAAGYSFSVAAENLAAGQRAPASVVADWMASPGHRANILNCELTQVGVGRASGGDYGTYWVQDFGTP
ncbi:CAP domain-containing protein [Parafrankia elaeagni]|uniref:CAP domain-containing protein n=1 Tax=Parafrankia elaeagni TaxID=222534 RepID=UPI001E4CC1DC|nr:CAP domain-containing protein [Parafrankia elaeagni]